MSEQPIRHFGEAHRATLEALKSLVGRREVERALLSPDIFARIRVALWMAAAPSPEQRAELERTLQVASSPFWGGLWLVTAKTPDAVRELL